MARGLQALEDRPLALVLSAALVAYLASDAVAFDTFGSMFAFFLVAACLDACLDGAREAPPGAAPRKGAQRPPTYRRLAPVLVSLVVLGTLFANVQIALAVAGYRAAQDDFAHDPSSGVAAYAAVFQRFSPYHGREKLNCAYMIIGPSLFGPGRGRGPGAQAGR